MARPESVRSFAKVGQLTKHSLAVYWCEFSPKGDRLATASHDTKIILWDVATGKKVGMLHGHVSWCLQVRWSPDGKYLASCSADMSVIFWDAQKFEMVTAIKDHESIVIGCSFSPDATLLVSCTRDDKCIHVWKASRAIQRYAGVLLEGVGSSDGC